MKKILPLIVCFLFAQAALIAQVTYSSTDFGVAGDSLFYSKIVLDTNYGYNYVQAGANVTWDFPAFNITTQYYQYYLDPKTAGYRPSFVTSCEAGGGTAAQCITRFNNLTNLALNSLDTTTLGNLKFYNQLIMDEKSTASLETNILGVTTRISGVNVPLTTTYITPDVVRVFPLAYGNADSSVSAYDIDLTQYGVNLIYHAHQKRVNHVDAWGSITTPYATYSSTIREYAVVYHYDTLIYDNNTVVIPPSYTFEYAWFDPTFVGPVFTASGNLVNGNRVFTTIEYLDTVHCLQPVAAERHQPVLPVIDPSVGSVTVNFTNLSQNANSYSWNFGDPGSGSNNTSANTNPSHVYSDSGTYTITLIACNTVCDPEKCDTETIKLVVDDSLELRAGFIAIPNATCAGDTVTFQNNSTNATSYFWNFGDLTSSTLKNPTHVYTTPGTYHVTLTASNGTTTDTATRVVTIQSPPNAVITASGPLTFCNGDSVILTASGGATYQWSNGHVGATLTVRASGTFTVKAINSCGNSTSSPVTVTVNIPVDTLTIAGDTAICSGDSVQLNANTGSGLTYDWRRNGQIIIGATQSSYWATTAGVYLVNVTENGCRGVSNKITITSTTTPAASISVTSSTVICSGDSLELTANGGTGLTYQWQLNGSNITGATARTYYAKLGGSYTAVVSRAACSATSNSIILTVNQTPAPVITPNSNAAFCSGDSLFMSIGTGINYTFQWMLGGSAITGATNEFYYASSAGSYSVAVSANGCTGTSTAVAVTQNPSPTANAGGPQSFTACSLNTITLGGSGGNPTASGGTSPYTYNWTPATALSDSAVANPTLSGLGTTTVYHVLVTDAHGCTATDSATVTVTGGTISVTISAIGDRTWCFGTNSSITLTAHPSGGSGGPYTFLWVPSSYLSTTTDSTTVASPTPVGVYSYTVVVTDHLGCQGSANAPITVLAVPSAVITALDTTSPCAGDSVHLTTTPGSGYTYQWWQNGSPIAGATDINYTTIDAGPVVVVITNSTCADTSGATNITVRANPVAAISAPNGLTFCAGGNITLNANTGGNLTYQWYENGYGIAGATGSSYAASDSGSFSVAVTLNGCTEYSDTLTDTINPLPNDSITVGAATTFCQGGNVTLIAQSGNGYAYQWQNNGVDINGATSADFVADSTGLFDVVVSALNCSSTSTGVDVTVYPYPLATITAGSDTQFCQNDSVTLSAPQGSGYLYQWLMNDDTVDGSTSNSLVVYASGEYNVLISSNGCVSSSNYIGVDVVALPEPVIYQSNDTMYASPATTYQWYEGGTLITGATQQFYVSTVAGTFSVQETDSGMCAQTSLPFSFVPTGINAVELNTGISVYPNPAHDAVNISISTNTESNITITLYDMLGNEVASAIESKTQAGLNTYAVSLAELPESVYMLKVFDGKNTATTKIVKQ